MGYIFGLILLLLLFVVLHFFTELTLKEKIGVFSVLGLLILGAYLYNQQSEDRRIHLEKVLLDFSHGKTISCKDMDVNNTQFAYSSGTQTFLGLKNSEMSGRIISLEQCQ